MSSNKSAREELERINGKQEIWKDIKRLRRIISSK